MRNYTLIAILFFTLFTWNAFSQVDPTEMPESNGNRVEVEEIKTMLVRQSKDGKTTEVLVSDRELDVDDLDSAGDENFQTAQFLQSQRGTELVLKNENELTTDEKQRIVHVDLSKEMKMDNSVYEERATPSFYYAWWWGYSYTYWYSYSYYVTPYYNYCFFGFR